MNFKINFTAHTKNSTCRMIKVNSNIIIENVETFEAAKKIANSRLTESGYYLIEIKDNYEVQI